MARPLHPAVLLISFTVLIITWPHKYCKGFLIVFLLIKLKYYTMFDSLFCAYCTYFFVAGSWDRGMDIVQEIM